MKKLSIILACVLVILAACTKSKEVHPEIGDGNDEIVTVSMKNVHVEYSRTDHAELNRVMFHYSLAEIQEFEVAEMTKRESFFELTLNDLLSDTLYHYYYELFPNNGDVFNTSLKTFHTQAFNQPQPPTPPVVELPTVVTAEVSEITTNSAICGGEVTNEGGTEVTERGICWSTNANPTLNDNHIVAGFGLGGFTVLMDSLQDNTIYHICAYATNEVGTAYGLDKEFNTLSGGGSGVPEGAISGLFTINENGDQVYFSQGNLQYQASTNTWRFAENQWDYVGSSETVWGGPNGNMPNNSNHLISPLYSGWIDLFGWGTSGYNHGAISYQPWAISQDDAQYYAYGLIDKNLNDETMQADWGYNPISNGGNIEHQWRTMTEEEWYFVLFSRSTISGGRFAKAIVNETWGVILLPDDWSPSIYPLNDLNDDTSHFMSNMISLSDWNILESNGAVFLPPSGIRHGTSCGLMGSCGAYHTATRSYYYDSNSTSVSFSEEHFFIGGGIGANRCHARAVRLVQDAR